MRFENLNAEPEASCKKIVCAHGEGPAYHARHNCLYWLDIDGKKLHRLSLSRKTLNEWPITGRVGKVVVHKSNNLLVYGNSLGIFLFNPNDRKIEPICKEAAWFDGELLANDAAVDPRGRFWFGTMHAEEKPLAGLWRIDSSKRVVQILKDVQISNGMTWIWNNGVWHMYYIDSPTQQILRWKFDIVSGAIDTSEKAEVIYSFNGNHYPDGMTCDFGRNLLVAVWGGGEVLRIDPQRRSVIQRIATPGASQSSACCWGGPKLDELYITTSRQGLSAEKLAGEPNAGRLFVCRPGGRGVPEVDCFA
jgi:sugar lactone lactonase YvrE